ncbi:MAG: trehalose-phosphatase [Gemmatimonadota bacterium]
MSMHNLLADPFRGDVTRVSGTCALLAFDFDGTLAPIVASPDNAAMEESTRVRLTELAECRSVAIITGRSLADIQPRLAGVRAAAIVGNHGIEPSPQMAGARETVESWMPILTNDLGDMAGVQIENKGHSLALHYRHATSSATARAAIDDSVRRLGPGVRRVEGIEVVNLVPVGAPHKGDALQRLRRELRSAAVFYIGDEETDEDAFATLDDGVSIAVRVGITERSKARYFIPDQADIDAVLDLLLMSVRQHDRRDVASDAPPDVQARPRAPAPP